MARKTRPTRSNAGHDRFRDWLQVDCTLFATAPDGEPYVAWSELSEAVARWRDEGKFRRFFFMRKPPGLRLRFSGEALTERLLPVVVPWLERAEARNCIRGFRFALYEPEVFRFGGPTGMEVAHDQFDRDSRIVLGLEGLPREEREADLRGAFSLRVIGDLFERCVEDGAEVWDLWKRVQRILDLVPCPPSPAPTASG